MPNFPKHYKTHWFFILKSISALPCWDHDFYNCNLITFKVSRFIGLISLNIFDNCIDYVEGSGLVFCSGIVSLDLSSSQILKVAQLNCIIYLCSIRHLWILDNTQSHCLFTLDEAHAAEKR
jgi:hypothetical protein